MRVLNIVSNRNVSLQSVIDLPKVYGTLTDTRKLVPYPQKKKKRTVTRFPSLMKTRTTYDFRFFHFFLPLFLVVKASLFTISPHRSSNQNYLLT